uniref:CCHC-type domain-containing protein n=1 Tax=Paramormyrops kingsleyae TaxID=1676925 RepID=A0A3B3S5S3_9TELE
MDPDTTMDYDCLKEAILAKYEINAEKYRQQFRALETSPTETPQELYIRLKDLFCKWVKFDQSSKEELMETLVLEQYLRVLYVDVRTWVREHNPATAAEAANLVESFVAAHRGPRGYQYAGVLDRQRWGKSDGPGKGAGSGITASDHRAPPPLHPDRARPQGISCFNCGQVGHKSPACPLRKSKYSHLCYVPHSVPRLNTQESRDPVVTIELNGKPVKALVDTGCSQTLVQADLVSLEFQNCNDKLTICCVHGESSELATADVYVRVNGQTYLLRVGLVSKLPYPVLLGQDLPVLPELVNRAAWCGVVTRAKAREQQADMTVLPFYGEDVPVEPTCTRQQRCDRRRQTVEESVQHNAVQMESVDSPEMADCVINDNLAEEQGADITLKPLFKRAEEGVVVPALGKEGYIMQNNLLYRQSEDGLQLVIPQKY